MGCSDLLSFFEMGVILIVSALFCAISAARNAEVKTAGHTAARHTWRSTLGRRALPCHEMRNCFSLGREGHSALLWAVSLQRYHRGTRRRDTPRSQFSYITTQSRTGRCGLARLSSRLHLARGCRAGGKKATTTTPSAALLTSQGPHGGKDQGASQYLAFAGADAYGGKPYITTQLSRQGPPATTAPETVALEQRTDVIEPGTPPGVSIQPYNETLWFTARRHPHLRPRPPLTPQRGRLLFVLLPAGPIAPP